MSTGGFATVKSHGIPRTEVGKFSHKTPVSAPISKLNY